MAANTRADTWLAQQHDKLRAIRHALGRTYFDPPLTTPRSRTPNAIEQTATDRPAGDYQPTPTGPSSSKPIAEVDPTAAAVFKWEATVQQSATKVADAVAQLHSLAVTASTRPKMAAPPPPPDLPPTRVTGTGHLSVDVTPDRSMTYADRALTWTAAVLPTLADVIRHEHKDATEPWQASSTLTKLASALGVRLCRCDDNCGLPAPPYGQGRIRAACRQRTSRRNRKNKGTHKESRHTRSTASKQATDTQMAYSGSTPDVSTKVGTA